MTGKPFMCPTCGCPLQPMCDTQGEIVGTIQDALARHTAVVHPNEEPA